MVTKIKFQPNCYNFLLYRGVYTVVVVICALIPLLFLIDPIALPSQIKQADTEECDNSSRQFRISITNTTDMTIKGPLGITGSKPACYGNARPNGGICKIRRGDQTRTVSSANNTIVFRNKDSIVASQTNGSYYTKLRIQLYQDKTVYNDGEGTIFQAFDIQTYNELSTQRSIAVGLLAVILVAAIIIITFIWFSCEGWCDCESPWRSAEQTVGGDMFV